MTDSEALRAAVCIQRHKAHLGFDAEETCQYCGVGSLRDLGHSGQATAIIWKLTTQPWEGGYIVPETDGDTCQDMRCFNGVKWRIGSKRDRVVIPLNDETVTQ